MRLYTAGTADFEKIRQNNRIYVDKTDLIYRLTKESDFVFLGRPRRFVKSLLCSTLKYYFQGRKDLFEGLTIAELEQEWKPHQASSKSIVKIGIAFSKETKTILE